ncbi:hypothetical protein MS2017_0819 [Bathymodiolus thermophilus thioautotrophic gill symbiont]|uniref:Lipoprotein n=1 Tax=Bathymodiolus thermophilus thioautotrophic gill symbiont TaxID=2360 RepID=A0A3G3IL34_9GAMM|nr:hypothetical protein [Bathymodiolus thermophilus thioautotrophic gill symbiont]AYQ56543.1 hypothetical protein MS2017_0819 [Bathymodiolus thermophilus thioautotrophic gill symbiont]
MRKILLLILLIFFTSSCEKTYTRSECITKVKLYWDKELTKEKRLEVNNKFHEAQTLIWTNQDKLKLLRANIVFEYSKNIKPEFMYSQYEYECENKEKMLFSFLEHIKFYVPNFPKYQILNEIVKPSVKTISLSGHWWIDKAKFRE